MNKKFIIISIGGALIIGVTIVIFFITTRTNNTNTNSSNSQSNSQTTITANNSAALVDNTYLPVDYSQYENGAVPTSEVKNRLELDKKTDSTYYVYSKVNDIILTYERESFNDKKPIYVRVEDNKLYLSLSEDNLQSGQSIEVININETLRFRDIPSIIREQILIADEKVGCKVEEKNGRYTIKPKTNTQTCGNYADINNKFFVKPIEDGSAISKLIFVNAGDQELSYDGSMKGKYWYESVIVE